MHPFAQIDKKWQPVVGKLKKKKEVGRGEERK